jgi:hypothetical protein
MSMLVPCSGCQRHVRVGDDACPFCGSRTAAAFAAAKGRPSARVGLKRAALFALSTTVAVSACGSEGGDSGKSASAASQGTGAMPGATMTNTTPTGDTTSDAELPGDEGAVDDGEGTEAPDDAETGEIPGVDPGEEDPSEPTEPVGDDDVDEPPDVEPPNPAPTQTTPPEGTSPPTPKPTATVPNMPPTVVALYGAIPAPIDEEPPAAADAGVDFDPEGEGGSQGVDEPGSEGGAGGYGGRGEPPPQVQPLYGAVPAPQD